MPTEETERERERTRAIIPVPTLTFRHTVRGDYDWAESGKAAQVKAAEDSETL